MNRKEVFVMTFYCLDAYWEEHQSGELGMICSGMNPFLFADQESADPAIWSEFCALVHDEEYTAQEGFEKAKEYVKTLGSADAITAINDISPEIWEEAYKNTQIE